MPWYIYIYLTCKFKNPVSILITQSSEIRKLCSFPVKPNLRSLRSNSLVQTISRNKRGQYSELLKCVKSLNTGISLERLGKVRSQTSPILTWLEFVVNELRNQGAFSHSIKFRCPNRNQLGSRKLIKKSTSLRQVLIQNVPLNWLCSKLD